MPARKKGRTTSYNRTLAKCVAAAALLAAVALAWYVLRIPEEALEAVNELPIRVLLVVSIELILINLAWGLFRVLYQPAPSRMCLWAMRHIAFLGSLVTLGPPALFGLERARVDAGTDTGFHFSASFAVGGAASGLAVMGLLLLAFCVLYSRELRLQQRSGLMPYVRWAP